MPLIGTRGAASAQGFGEFAQQASVVQAEAIDFDGTNDFLRRTSDLTGNTDGKTFTFSFWTWIPVGAPLGFVYYANNAGAGRFLVEVGAGQTVRIRGWRTTGTITLDVTTSSVVPAGTFANILVSVDLANAANRSIYINDVLTSATWTTYGNNDIEFTCSQHDVCSNGSAADGAKRLSNIFLDYTYRDMSITANRRLFVTADLKPAAGQAALNPIMYLPMSDPTAPGLNQGTGGNFTLTGVVARSGRGPNQYNAPYSDFDGSADYLSRTTLLTGVAVSSAFTFQCVFNTDTQTAQQYLFTVRSGTADRFYVLINTDFTNARINIEGYNSSATNLLYLSTVYGGIVPNRNYVLTVSLNLTSTATRHIYINGESVSATWSPYTNGSIDFAPSTPTYAVGGRGTTASMNGRLGALWFNTSYIDLSVPANLAKFVSGTGINAAPVDLGANGELPTGTSPLIYLPMYGNAAGLNYGTGGNFTVNSGPYTGARGPNEFWGNKARGDNPDGSNNQGLIRTTQLAGIADSKTFSCSFWTQFNSSSGGVREDNIAGFWIGNSNATWRIFRDTSDNLRIVAGSRLSATVSGAITTSPAFVQICVDLADTAKRFVYINGVAQTVTWSTYVNDLIDFTVATQTLMCRFTTGAAGGMDGSLGEFYFTTNYIDFSQEANRLKFRDAFGNPVDLSAQISSGAIPTPLIYMRMPPTSFGTNSGTGGNFALGGSPTDGGQF